MLAAPLFLTMAMVSALGAGLWLGALGIQYRDIRQLIPFGVQIWMFISPVIYPTSMVPPRVASLYALNPLVGALEGFRWSLLGTSTSHLEYLIAMSTIVSL